MKKRLGIYNNNQVNKYGYRFTVECLEVGLAQTWEYGTPMFISHDYHRPLGWSKPLGLQVMPTQVALLGVSYFPENNKEQDFINSSSVGYLSNKLFNVDEVDKQMFRSKLGQHLSGNEVFIVRECISVIDDNIARKMLPKLFVGDEYDKRTLVPLKNLKQIAPGVFEVEGFAVFAHRYFRRSLSQINNLNDSFLSKLYELSKISELDVKIALDPNSLGLIESYHLPIELDYWWGPKFNESLLDIPSGVTHHEAPEQQKLFHGISGTEFWWHKQDGIQSLECEEIRDEPTLGIGKDEYGCRYVHSMINPDSGKPNHLDGAIRVYNEDKFLNRIEVDISSAGKDTKYLKLWRIDGDFEVSTWKELICDFYRDNHLPGEYLSGKDRNDFDATEIEQNEPNFLNSYLPPYLEPKEGLELFVSYHRKEYFPSIGPTSVMSLASYGNDKEVVKLIELTALDLIKLVQRELDHKVTIVGDITYVAYEDLDINFPRFLLKGNDAVDNANKVIECLQILIGKLLKSGADRVITFSIAIEYEAAIVQYSFVSNIVSLEQYMRDNFIQFPPKFEDIGSWCSHHHKLMNLQFKTSALLSGRKSLLEDTGYHMIKRTLVPMEMEYVDGNSFGLKIHESEQELLEAVDAGKITMAPAVLVKSTNCNTCGKDYLSCLCIHFVDDEQDKGAVMITDMEPLGFIWTRERA